jgi:hypothetical protein
VNKSKGVTSAISPSQASVTTTPGSVSLLFRVNNTGNTDDTYTASITQSGGLTATLGGPSAKFALSALGTAEFPLNATVTDPSGGYVQVTVTSLSDNTVNYPAYIYINVGTTPPPTAVANPSSGNVPVNRLAILNGSGSTSGGAYLWTVTGVPQGSAVTNASINFATSSLASVRPDVIGAYSFDLHVSNSSGAADATVNYNAIDAPPVPVTGNSFNAPTGVFAFLNGTYSYDPDGQPITFNWSLVTKPDGSGVTSGSIYNAQTPRPFFIPDKPGAYKLQLVVSDATGTSSPVTVTVTAYTPTSSIPPNADAGRNRNAGLNGTVTVSGSASVDPNAQPQPLTYQWTLPAKPTGSAATLTGATSVSAQFVPDVAGDYVLSLVVSNSHGTSQPVTTTVHAFSTDVPPNANAGANQFVTPGSAASLNAQASTDPDNGPSNLAYVWWLDSLPPASAATLVHPLTATPQFVADKSGYFIGEVEANDGLLAGFANTLVTSAAVCDADANGVLTQTDIALISAALGQTVLPNDPRDFNHDGTITAADVTGCTNLVSAAPPSLQISPGSFTELVAANSAPVKQALQISSTGTALGFTVTSNRPWLSTDVSSGSTSTVSTVNAQVDAGTLAPATYAGTLTFTASSGAIQTVGVTVTVAAASGGSLCDVNQDGVVTVADVQRMVNEALGEYTAKDDLNLDGVVNVVDIQIVIDAVLNLGCKAQ